MPAERLRYVILLSQLGDTHLFKAFMELYSQILDNAGAALGAILRHVRDHKTEGFLVHCTGGLSQFISV